MTKMNIDEVKLHFVKLLLHVCEENTDGIIDHEWYRTTLKDEEDIALYDWVLKKGSKELYKYFRPGIKKGHKEYFLGIFKNLIATIYNMSDLVYGHHFGVGKRITFFIFKIQSLLGDETL